LLLDWHFDSSIIQAVTLSQDVTSRWFLPLSRRDFLSLCGSTSALLIPAPLRGAPAAISTALNSPAASLADYRLTPHYRVQSPLEEVIRKTQPGLDAFPGEKDAAEVEAVLGEWGAALRQFPADFRPIEKSLSPALVASPLTPSEMRPVRSEPALEVQRVLFSRNPTLDRAAFVPHLRSLVSSATPLITTEFKIPDIAVISQSPFMIRTRVRYDLVGSGSDFPREERIGYWELEWERNASGEWRVGKWQALEETRSRASGPVFVDVTAGAFRGNASYTEQLLRGTDYWRTVLDAASGMDVYGNNGIACGDIDNDGFDDLYVCQAAGLPNRLYRNRGDGTFEDVTEAAGVGVLDNTPCALFADVRNDGHQDLLVVRATGPLLFLNQGNGKFRLKPDAFRFAQEPQGTFTGAAFGDYDRDGWLDVYFCLYSYYQGLDQYRFPTPYYDAQNGPPNFLFRNNRDGSFTDVTAQAGLNQNNNRYSFDCHWCDFDNDGWPDLYVVNDFGRKNLYRNKGDGTFSDVAEEAGVLDIGPGMSACWFDYDNDGKQDLYVSDMWEASGLRVTMQEAFMKGAPAGVHALYRRHAKGNALFHNQGNGHFADRSAVAGVETAGWSWSSHAWDFDHDGYPDLYIANGMISGPNKQDLESFFWRQVVSQSPLEAHPARSYEQGWNAINELIRSDGTWAGYQRNVFYGNNRDGTFSNVSGAAGLDFPDDSRAFALADFDHDGRLEVFLKNRTGPQLRLLRNEMKGLGDAIAFRLRGRKSNRDAIGAALTVETAQGRQTKFLQAGTGFCSQHTKEVFMGLGKAAGPLRAQVRWPSGLVQEFRDVPVNHRVEIEEGSEQFHARPFLARAGLSHAPAPQQAAPLPSISETWLLVPVPAPDFELPDLAGRRRSLASFRGHRVLLNFWATWCAPCHKELQAFEQLHTGWSAEGLQLVTVNVNDPTEASTVRAFAREKNLSFITLLSSDDMVGIYSLLNRYLFDRRRNLGIPTSFLIDENGFIVKVYQGPLRPEQAREDARRLPLTPEERVRLGLPFAGTFYGGEFHRNEFTYGVAFFQREYLDQALASFHRVIQNSPDNVDAYYNLGTIYLKKQMPAEARQHLRRALDLRPGHADALNNLGLLAAEEGHTDEAIRYFEAAVKHNPDYVIALENLGNIYRQKGQTGQAQQALERALQIDPEEAEVNYSLGMLFAQQNDTERARKYLQTALRLRPDYPEALNNLGVLYVLTGKPTEAIASFRDCIRVAPNFDQPYLNLARVYVAQGERPRAQDVLRQLLAKNPDHLLARKALDQISR
jgi:tetratricopeptide (TPR) repeat protein/peroxiredoxin